MSMSTSRRRSRAGGGAKAQMINYCSICADPVSSKSTSVTNDKNLTQLWERFFRVVNVALKLSPPTPPPICSGCENILVSVVGLKEKLSELEKELAAGLEFVESRLVQSEGRFVSGDARVSDLRSKLITARRRADMPSINPGPVIPSTKTMNQQPQQCQPNQTYPSFSDLIYTPPQPYGMTTVMSMPTLFPEQLCIPQNVPLSTISNEPPQIQYYQESQPPRPEVPPPQYFALANNNDINNEIAHMEVATNTNSNSSELQDDDSQPDQSDGDPSSNCSSDEKEDKSSWKETPPTLQHRRQFRRRATSFKKPEANKEDKPLRIRKGRTFTAEQITNMLIKRRNAEIENFSSILKTDDGKMYYENYEIIRNPESGMLSCGNCGWCETNDKSRPWLQTRAMKIHIKGFHLGLYKCSSCSKTFRSMASLNGHKSSVGKCGGVPRARSTCHICGKLVTNISLTSHTWTHKTEAGKKAALAEGLVSENFVKQRTPTSCDRCGKTFGFVRSLRCHQRICKKLTSNSSKELADAGSDLSSSIQNTDTQRLEKGCSICNICGKSVRSRNLPDHKWTHKSEEEKKQVRRPKRYKILKNAQCAICGLITYQNYLPIHIQIHKKPSERQMWKCSVEGCDAAVAFKAHLKTHMLAVHNQRTMTSPSIKWVHCPVPGCKKKCPSSRHGAINDHVLRQHTPYVWKPHVCEICKNRTYKFKADLQNHKRLMHIRKNDGPELFKFECPTCSIKYTTERALSLHVNFEHKQQETVVKEQKKEIPINEKEYEEMIKSAARKGTNTCKSCDRSFQGLKRFREHLQQHHLRLTYVPCPICERPVPCTTLRSSRKFHDLTHFGVTELVEFVNSGKKLPPDMVKEPLSGRGRRHISHCDQHGIEIECGQCSQKDFTTVAQLQQHIFDAHPVVSVKRKPEPRTVPEIVGKFSCSSCSARFATSGGLLRHVKQKHKIRQDCTNCSETFDGIRALSRHVKLVHTDQPHGELQKQIQELDLLSEETNEDQLPPLTPIIDVKKYWEAMQRARKQKLSACPFCGMVCNSLEGLRHHAARHINKSNLSTVIVMSNPAPCVICNRSFSTVAALEKHIFAAHPIIEQQQSEQEMQKQLMPKSPEKSTQSQTNDTASSNVNPSQAILNIDPLLTHVRNGTRFLTIGKKFVARRTASNKIRLLAVEEPIQPVVVVIKDEEVDEDDDVLCLD